ncbi:hypothetical protein ACRRTK_018682 [Alexandromys fortis]
MVAARNTALLCMLALVTEASLPVTGDSTRDQQTWDVTGQCKVVATRYSNESQDFRVNGDTHTMSSVSSALSNTKDSPVLLDYLEESEVHRQQAHNALDKYKRENEGFASFRVDRVDRVIKARGGERTNYYVNFSMRNCSTQYFHRRPPMGK